eukprot:scaffold2744_cov136-Cylindrotheca_fusiformis.AAC.2
MAIALRKNGPLPNVGSSIRTGVPPPSLAVGDYNNEKNTPPPRVLTAYLEPKFQSTPEQPIPPRTWTRDDLTRQEFPELSSCSKLPEQWPVDDYPEDDPFLPWIHDVFPTHDGKFIQFVAQNKRRCKTGSTKVDVEAAKHFEPQITLFEHVPVKKLDKTKPNEEQRYRIASHEDADPETMATRFLCRFTSDDGFDETTLSVYNFDYEWASLRKHQKVLFHENGRDTKQVHTSQLLFKCPVPLSLQDTIRNGSSVIDDYATLFVDVVPIRTPPRYGHPAAFLQPYYTKSKAMSRYENIPSFDIEKEWGSNHILPPIGTSGRWANIPICKPSLMTYYGDEEPPAAKGNGSPGATDTTGEVEIEKKHKLVSCLWASAGYATRGERFAINDGQRRLFEWITYKRMLGVEHFYLYENSGAHPTGESLHSVADKFPPGVVTVINWPSQICNNRPNNVDSPGERSSQYAAEASCRLRFGPHVDWIAQFDIDEYLVPMGNLTSITQIVDKLDEEGNKIVAFGSWRAWPRRRFIETPEVMSGRDDCGRDQRCFQLRIPMNYTMLQSYNCDRQKPGEKVKQMPAEKQIYRPDYVLHHFIHYSTVTTTSNMNQEDVEKAGLKWNGWSAFPDQLQRFGDEVTEGTDIARFTIQLNSELMGDSHTGVGFCLLSGLMIHTKAVATQDTVFWEETCSASYTGSGTCRLGTPFPDDMTGVDETKGDEGWKFNCYINKKVDNFFVPRLEEDLRKQIPELDQRLRMKES